MGTYDALTGGQLGGEYLALAGASGVLQMQTVSVSRQGTAVGNYTAGFTYKNSRPHGHIAPRIDLGEKWPMLFFEDTTAPIQVGDLITLADGLIFKAYDVRGPNAYLGSLQVDLQRIPYANCAVWVPGTPAADGSDPFREIEPLYVLSGSMLLYIEPTAEAEKAYVAAALGSISVNSALIFSLYPIANVSCVVYQYNSGGNTITEYWATIENSSHYPVTGDFRVTAKKLLLPPPGVTA